MTSRAALRARLEYLCSLPRGWLDGDGEPVPLVVAAYVDRWLTEAPDDEFAGWDMGPLERGGINLERIADNGYGVADDSVLIDASSITFHRLMLARNWAAWAEVDILTGETIEVCIDPMD